MSVTESKIVGKSATSLGQSVLLERKVSQGRAHERALEKQPGALRLQLAAGLWGLHPLGTLDNIWRYFWLSRWERCCWHRVGRSRGTAKHPAMCGTASPPTVCGSHVSPPAWKARSPVPEEQGSDLHFTQCGTLGEPRASSSEKWAQ